MRRSDQPAGGTVVFSVELELAIDRPARDRQQRMDHVTGELLELFQQQRLPATWAVADPARSAARSGILASTPGHEIAVLGERSWLGRGAGPLRIERELSRRVEGARQVGIPVATLILRNVSEPLDLDLLLAHQIAAVSYPPNSVAAIGPSSGPRFGVWHAPQAWRLPRTPRWWLPLGWQAAGKLREVIRQQRILHVAIDGDALVDSDQAGLAQVSTIVGQVARLRQQGKLKVRTLAQLGAANLAHRFPQPAKSLLAPAA